MFNEDVSQPTRLSDLILFDERPGQEAFLDFISRALTWDPETRPSAGELLRHPWLDFNIELRA